MKTQKALAALAASAMLLLFNGGISAAQEKAATAPQQKQSEERKIPEKKIQERHGQEKQGLVEPTHSMEGKEEKPGELAVFSEPPNLEVMLDGEKIGETPVAVEVKPGEHTLSIEKAEKTVNILPGESLRLSLFKGEFIEIPEEEEKPVVKAPEQPKIMPGGSQQARRERRENPQKYDQFYWPQNPRGPIY
jgi:hypothetical protein